MPWPCCLNVSAIAQNLGSVWVSLSPFTASQGGLLAQPPLSDPPGHPTTRPFGSAALLGLAGSHKTRRYAPQTSYDSFSRQPCATRPRKRDSGPCMRHVRICAAGPRHLSKPLAVFRVGKRAVQ